MNFRTSTALWSAMNDGGRHYAYPAPVRLEIAEAEMPEYLLAADFLNVNDVEILCCSMSMESLGERRVAIFLRCSATLRMPVVTTLHTILKEPSPAQKLVMDELVALGTDRRHERPWR